MLDVSQLTPVSSTARAHSGGLSSLSQRRQSALGDCRLGMLSFASVGDADHVEGGPSDVPVCLPTGVHNESSNRGTQRVSLDPLPAPANVWLRARVEDAPRDPPDRPHPNEAKLARLFQRWSTPRFDVPEPEPADSSEPTDPLGGTAEIDSWFVAELHPELAAKRENKLSRRICQRRELCHGDAVAVLGRRPQGAPAAVDRLVPDQPHELVASRDACVEALAAVNVVGELLRKASASAEAALQHGGDRLVAVRLPWPPEATEARCRTSRRRWTATPLLELVSHAPVAQRLQNEQAGVGGTVRYEVTSPPRDRRGPRDSRIAAWPRDIYLEGLGNLPCHTRPR